MTDHELELQLQRFVDDELEHHERARVLSQFESAGSLHEWRKLALSFVENQVIGGSFADREAPQKSPPGQPLGRRLRRWANSMTSVAAAALIGVFSGVGAHYIGNPRSPSPVNQISPGSDMQMAANNSSNPNDPKSSPSQAPIPVMNPNLASLSTGGPNRISVPVFPGSQWQSLPQLKSVTNVPEDVRKQLEAEGYILDSEVQWHRAQLSDGQTVLTPVEVVRLRRPER